MSFQRLPSLLSLLFVGFLIHVVDYSFIGKVGTTAVRLLAKIKYHSNNTGSTHVVMCVTSSIEETSFFIFIKILKLESPLQNTKVVSIDCFTIINLHLYIYYQLMIPLHVSVLKLGNTQI